MNSTGFAEGQCKEGDVLTAELFRADSIVDVRGWSKGKGFQGVVKRHGFAALADRPTVSITGAGHQVHSVHLHFPSRVLPGMRMAGRTGGNQVMSMDMKVVKLMAENDIIIVKGSVPGPKGGYVIITK